MQEGPPITDGAWVSWVFVYSDFPIMYVPSSSSPFHIIDDGRNIDIPFLIHLVVMPSLPAIAAAGVALRTQYVCCMYNSLQMHACMYPLPRVCNFRNIRKHTEDLGTRSLRFLDLKAGFRCTRLNRKIRLGAFSGT